MPIRVQVGGKIVEFPDGTTEDVMRGALSKLEQGDKLQTLKEANAKPIKEPTTYMGGFMKGANDYATELGRSMFEGAAHPKTAGDFLSLLLPSSLGASGGSSALRGFKAVSESEPVGNKVVRGAVNTVREGGQVAGKAADAIPSSSVYAPAKLPLNVIKGVTSKLPSEPQMLGVERYKPNVSGVPDRGIPQGDLPQSTAAMVDPHMPNVSGTPDGGIPQGEMPTATPPIDLETALEAMTRKNMEEHSASPRQPDHVPYGGVEVPHRVKKPRMASETANPYGKDVEPEVEDVIGAAPEGVTVTSDKPKLSAEETAGMLRRMFGSRDGGRMLYGDSLPASERGAAMKRLAPGPSQTPLAAEARINGTPQEQSLEDALRQIILDRSKVP